MDSKIARSGLGWLLIGAAVVVAGLLAKSSDAGWGQPVLVIGAGVTMVALVYLAYELLRRD